MGLEQRLDAPELMDTAVLTGRENRRALRFLAQTAKWFGGASLFIRQFEEWSRVWDPNQTVTILDVGTGGGDIPLALADWASRRGFKVAITGLELVPGIADIARQRTAGIPGITVVTGDLFKLAESPERYDYVTASLFLHHMPDFRAIDALREFGRLATRGIVVGDLDRSRASLVAVTAAAWILGNRIVRHDGPLSVRRSFTLRELDIMARDAGLPWLTALNQPWFRVRLAGERSHA